jgi:hypothetical protein
VRGHAATTSNDEAGAGSSAKSGVVKAIGGAELLDGSPRS